MANELVEMIARMNLEQRADFVQTLSIVHLKGCKVVK